MVSAHEHERLEDIAARQRVAEELNQQRRANDRWHIGREIPLALVLAVLLQTVLFVWWMASLSNKVDTAVATIAEFKTERYTREDARRDRDLDEQKRQTQKVLDEQILRAIVATEARLDRVQRQIENEQSIQHNINRKGTQ